VLLWCHVAAPLAVLKLSNKVKNVIATSQNIATALTNNPSFPSPTPPLATLQADIAALNVAETVVLSRTKGAVGLRERAASRGGWGDDGEE
jgi:hypothetical protein